MACTNIPVSTSKPTKSMSSHDIVMNSDANAATTRINNEILIELVRERPYLYYMQHSKHKDQTLRRNAWDAVSTILCSTGNDCYVLTQRKTQIQYRYWRYCFSNLFSEHMHNFVPI